MIPATLTRCEFCVGDTDLVENLACRSGSVCRLSTVLSPLLAGRININPTDPARSPAKQPPQRRPGGETVWSACHVVNFRGWIEAEAPEDRGRKIGGCHGIQCRVRRQSIACSVYGSLRDSATCEEDAVTVRPVVPALMAVDARRPAELTHDDHQRGVGPVGGLADTSFTTSLTVGARRETVDELTSGVEFSIFIPTPCPVRSIDTDWHSPAAREA